MWVRWHACERTPGVMRHGVAWCGVVWCGVAFGGGWPHIKVGKNGYLGISNGDMGTKYNRIWSVYMESACNIKW